MSDLTAEEQIQMRDWLGACRGFREIQGILGLDGHAHETVDAVRRLVGEPRRIREEALEWARQHLNDRAVKSLADAMKER